VEGDPLDEESLEPLDDSLDDDESLEDPAIVELDPGDAVAVAPDPGDAVVVLDPVVLLDAVVVLAPAAVEVVPAPPEPEEVAPAPPEPDEEASPPEEVSMPRPCGVQVAWSSEVNAAVVRRLGQLVVTVCVKVQTHDCRPM